MRILIGLVLLISIAAGMWMLQPNAKTADMTNQARTPVVRITDIPLPSQSTVPAGLPLSQQDTVVPTPDAKEGTVM